MMLGSAEPKASTRPRPAETPKNLVEILRMVFIDAVRDPALLAQADRARLEINAAPGEEFERNVKELLRLDFSLVARPKDILK